ncbi:hypothetical protein [Acidovorax sp. BL-A-41-H1]|uniref:hypothetical protein n=1 Tax=Acidovorax sp. BL-A-41-H1 TaxID=3421102 RepID=UPI003F78F807
MPYYAQLNGNGVVTSVTETAAVLPAAANLVLVDGLRSDLLGQTYNAITQQFTPPAAVPALRHVIKLAFRNRFTRAEKVALEMAALDNPAASLAQRQQSAALRADLKDQEGATFIDLDHADLRTGVQALEAAGLIAAGRALQILDAPVQEIERFRGG